jgi:membrane fusion protein, copper/silver efflux system
MSEDIHKYDPHKHEPLPEGEEEAPPYTHTMAIIRWVILGVMTLFALVMVLSYFGATPWAGAVDASIQYHCPMHPTYVSSQPGECPICGMTLVPIDSAGKEIKTGDSAVTTATPSESENHPTARPGQYTCPMDPEVISDTPGKCPVCGMNLEQVPPTTNSAPTGNDMSGMSGMGSSPVPGLVPITIEPKRLQLIGVRTGTVSTHSLDGSLRLIGYITPDETRLSNVQVRFSGWVKKLSVDQTGQFVESNQKLLSVYSQDLYQAEQEYVSAREAMNRDSDEDLRNTHKTLMDAAHLRLDLLGVPQEELALLDLGHSPVPEVSLRSPASGYVLEKNVINGQFIGPDQNLFTIADLSRVWVLADVYERDLTNIQIGQTALMTTSAYPGESFEGTVSFIYPSISEQTRTLKIRIEFTNSSNRLKPGMYAEVDLAGKGEGVLAVPADAVMDGGDRQYAFVIHDGIHFEPRLLKLGRSSDDYFEVLSGLSEGEQVVTSANFLIDSESRLKAAIAGMGGTQPDAHAGHGK